MKATEKFLVDFVEAKNGPNPLINCNKLWGFTLSNDGARLSEDLASYLLLGFPDDNTND